LRKIIHDDFDGDYKSSKDRLERMVDLLIKHGRPAAWNHHAFCISATLLVEAGLTVHKQIEAEIEGERRARRKRLSKTVKPN
jgi:hypothetical protein